jgi:pyruvate dehydrogenase E2 component (dihydrolipoamide acetyltransferase)
MEFESYYDGVLLHVGVETGKAAAVDSVLAIIGKEGEDISALKNSGSQSAKPANEIKIQSTVSKTNPPAIPDSVKIIRMPKLSDTMTEGVVSKWLKKKGDKVKSGDILAEIQTDKATMEFESYYDGVLMHIGVEESKGAPVDSVLAIVGNGNEDITSILEFESKPQIVKEPAVGLQNTKSNAQTDNNHSSVNISNSKIEKGGRVIASPLAKKIAKEKGIDISKVRGSGDHGRIIKKDIEGHTTTTANHSNIQFNNAVSFGQESYHEESISQMRKTIARRLTESKNGAPHFYLTIEADMENAIAARTAINAMGEVKVSFNDIVIKACASALRRHPKVNSSFLGDKIRFNHHIHIGVAVAIEDGLLVPVVRFSDQKSLSQISSEVKDFSKRAKERKLQPSDWEGNTFTVSNLGMFGIEEFTSIINSPESCILAVGAIRNVPVVKNGQVVPGSVMKMTLSCDHRSVDGATGAAFLQTLKQLIENPVTILA